MSEVKVLINAVNKSEAEFKKLKSDLKQTQSEGKKATTVWDRFGKAGKGAATDVSKAMEGVSGRAGILGSTLSKLGPVGVSVGAVLAGIGTAIYSGTMSMAEWERRLGRTEALLKSTGYAAGLTARELDNLARERDLATLGDRDEIMDAINLMQTFKSVTGDTFRESITLAQDMSAVTGQSLTSATTMLGKALEDPIQGLTAMRRVGVSFTEVEQTVIKAMTEANDIAGAQAKIMEVLRGQFAGASEGEAKDLLGTLDTLNYEWRDLMEAMGNTDVAEDGVEGLIQVVRDLEYSVKAVSGKFSMDEQVSQLESAIDTQKRMIDTLNQEAVKLPLVDSWIGKSAHIEEAQEKLAELEDQLKRIQALREGQDMRDMFVIKDQGAAAADSRARDYEIMGRTEADKAASDKAKAAAKEAESEAKAREKRIADYKDKLNEAVYGKEAVRAQKIEETYKQMLADGMDADAAGTWRTKELGATDDKKAETEAKAREKRLAEYQKELDEARLGAYEVKRREIEAKYQQMLADGVGEGDADIWRTKEFKDLDEQVKKSTSQWKDAYGEFGTEAQAVFGDLGDTLTGSLATGNAQLDKFLLTLIKISMVELGGRGQSSDSGVNFFSSFGSMLTSIFHEGGVIGGDAPTRVVPASLFANAPRRHSGFHEGGVIGGDAPTRVVPASLFANAPRRHSGGSLGPGERAFIGKDGELVLNEAQQTNVADAIRAGGASPVTVQLFGQDGRKLFETSATPQASGGGLVTKQEVAILFMQALSENTAGLTDFFKSGGF